MSVTKRLWLLLALLLPGTLFLSTPPSAAAQTPPTYWRYDATGEIGRVTIADLDGDGFDELLVVVDGRKLEIVRGDGSRFRADPYQFDEPIVAVEALSGAPAALLDDPSVVSAALIVVTPTRLLRLQMDGAVQWEQRLTSEFPPVALALATGSTAVAAELAVQYRDGSVQLFDAAGASLWVYRSTRRPADPPPPLLQTADLDQDGRVEVYNVYATGGGASLIAQLDLATGAPRWEQVYPDIVTALAVAPLGDGKAPVLAVGGQSGRLALFDVNGGQVWEPRTLNSPITALLGATWGGEPVIVAGAESGKLVAFTAAGQRLWDKAICPLGEGYRSVDRRCPGSSPLGRIAALSAPRQRSPRPVQPAALALLLDLGRSAELLLLDANLDVSAHYPAAPLANLPQLVDTNRDGLDELLRVTFGTLELLNPGTIARSLTPAWDFRLIALPVAVLVSDLNHDGAQELLIGAGANVYRVDANGAAVWVAPLDGELSHLGLLTLSGPGPVPLPPIGEGVGPTLPETESVLVVGYNSTSPARDATLGRGQINLMRPDSSLLWETPLSLAGRLTSLYVDDTADPPLVIVGTDQRVLTAFRLKAGGAGAARSWSAELLWSKDGVSPITAVTRVRRAGAAYLLAASELDIRLLDNAGNTVYYFNQNVLDETARSRSACRSTLDLFYLATVGAGESQECLGRNMGAWQVDLGSPLRPIRRRTGQYIYYPETERTWVRILQRPLPTDLLEPELAPLVQETELTRFTGVVGFLSGDLTGDGRDDFILAQSSGRVLLDLNETVGSGEPRIFDSSVRYLAAVRPATAAPPDLVVMTGNSIVSLLRFQPNYPPLLTAPTITRAENQYTIQIKVLDIEQGRIGVDLQVFDPPAQAWKAVGETKFTDASVTELVWTFSPRQAAGDLRYRFTYADGSDHRAILEPPPGPPPIVRVAWQIYLLGALTMLVAGLGGSLLVVRQRRQALSQARRFYRELQADPSQTIVRLHAQYDATGGAAEWLLALANVARQHEDALVAALADGLYLLGNQPAAGVPILLGALGRATPTADPAAWPGAATALQALRVTQQLLQAPSTTQLSLMQAELERLAEAEELRSLARLLPVFNALRDSERVESADDRLTYLSDAAALLRRLSGDLAVQSHTLVHVLMRATAERCIGLVGSEIETLRGRAKLDVRLKTLRIAPAAQNHLVLEIQNSGRAAAEQVAVVLEPGAVQPVGESRRLIPRLAPGRAREVDFEIALPPGDRFRVLFQVTFSDRQRAGKTFEYANVVHVLTPPRDFTPIANPYAPGTPLRRDSALFFGRAALFQFIADEAPRLARQHVLILVGQRRTGKTSALLRLSQHLPPQLAPVYIDCQSLGVMPGLAAFFQDIAWLIADTLAEQGYSVAQPEPGSATDNPGTWFQHSFIPAVQAQLPAGTQLVLVFDEFEALENLVEDGILPRTLFPYLRHLMQHSVGLSFIFVGTRRLEELTADYWSVLFNIALYKEIGYLDLQAARDLITQPVAPQILYDDLALDKIWRLTAGHPYFLQLVCYSLVKRANTTRTGYVTISDVNATVSEMLSLGEVHFAFIWQRSTPAERSILIAVAHLVDKETPFRPDEVVQVLAPFGIALSPAEVTDALGSLVRRQIMREINDGPTTLYELQLGLVGMWIEQSKGLGRLYGRTEGQPAVAY